MFVHYVIPMLCVLALVQADAAHVNDTAVVITLRDRAPRDDEMAHRLDEMIRMCGETRNETIIYAVCGRAVCTDKLVLNVPMCCNDTVIDERCVANLVSSSLRAAMVYAKCEAHPTAHCPATLLISGMLQHTRLRENAILVDARSLVVQERDAGRKDLKLAQENYEKALQQAKEDFAKEKADAELARSWDDFFTRWGYLGSGVLAGRWSIPGQFATDMAYVYCACFTAVVGLMFRCKRRYRRRPVVQVESESEPEPEPVVKPKPVVKPAPVSIVQGRAPAGRVTRASVTGAADGLFK